MNRARDRGGAVSSTRTEKEEKKMFGRDQRGIAVLTVAIIVAASTGVAVATPVVVDAVDVNPDSPFYGLERLGERIRMVSDEDQMKERWGEYAQLVAQGRGLEYRNILNEFTEKMQSVVPENAEAKQNVVMWMQEQMPGTGRVKLGLMKELCEKLRENTPAAYDELENILEDLKNIEQELPTADNEMMGDIWAHLVLIAEQLRQIAEQHENAPDKIREYFDIDNRLTDIDSMWNAEVGMGRGQITPAEFENELESFNEKLSEVQAMLEGAPENAPGRTVAERLVGVAVELRDNAVAAYGENKMRSALALIRAANVHLSNAERILEHASEWEPKFRENWAGWKEMWENMRAGWKETWENMKQEWKEEWENRKQNFPENFEQTGPLFLENFGQHNEQTTHQWRELWQEKWQEARGKRR